MFEIHLLLDCPTKILILIRALITGISFKLALALINRMKKIKKKILIGYVSIFIF